MKINADEYFVYRDRVYLFSDLCKKMILVQCLIVDGVCGIPGGIPASFRGDY